MGITDYMIVGAVVFWTVRSIVISLKNKKKGCGGCSGCCAECAHRCESKSAELK